MENHMLSFPPGVASAEEIVSKSISVTVSFGSRQCKKEALRMVCKQSPFAKVESLSLPSYSQKIVCQATFRDDDNYHPSVINRSSLEEPSKTREGDVVMKLSPERSTSLNVRKIWVRRRSSPVLNGNLKPISEEQNEIYKSGDTDDPKHVHEDANTGKYSVHQNKDLTVKDNELIPGSIFTGKVTNVQSYGAFVDIGAFSSGLIHISNMSKNYIRNVEDIVKRGQEVKVEIIFVDVKSRRISFKLITEEPEQGIAVDRETRSPGNTHPKGTSNGRIPATKPREGEVLTGTITKIIPSGVFVRLKDQHHGFLPATEVLSGTASSVETNSYFRVGQQIPVRVLSATKDQIRLSMKKQVQRKEDQEASVRSQEDRATSPFEIAFRRDKVLAQYLDEIEKRRNALQEVDDN